MSNSMAMESKSRLLMETEMGLPNALVNESADTTSLSSFHCPCPPTLGCGATGGGASPSDEEEEGGEEGDISKA